MYLIKGLQTLSLLNCTNENYKFSLTDFCIGWNDIYHYILVWCAPVLAVLAVLYILLPLLVLYLFYLYWYCYFSLCHTYLYLFWFSWYCCISSQSIVNLLPLFYLLIRRVTLVLITLDKSGYPCFDKQRFEIVPRKLER